MKLNQLHAGAVQGLGPASGSNAPMVLNQTDRPGAVWLEGLTAAMDEKKRPIFCVYSPDLEDEEAPLCDYVATRLLRFARSAAALAQMRGKNYSVGGVSMGIIGLGCKTQSDVELLRLGTVSVDQSVISGRIESGFYDHEEFVKAQAFMRQFKLDYSNLAANRVHGYSDQELLDYCLKMTLVLRDLMVGNEKLADEAFARQHGFRADVEYAQGANAIAAGTQGQRQ